MDCLLVGIWILGVGALSKLFMAKQEALKEEDVCVKPLKEAISQETITVKSTVNQTLPKK